MDAATIRHAFICEICGSLEGRRPASAPLPIKKVAKRFVHAGTVFFVRHPAAGAADGFLHFGNGVGRAGRERGGRMGVRSCLPPGYFEWTIDRNSTSPRTARMLEPVLCTRRVISGKARFRRSDEFLALHLRAFCRTIAGMKSQLFTRFTTHTHTHTARGVRFVGRADSWQRGFFSR